MRVIHYNQHATTNGDGTGTKNFIGDYSGTAVDGYVKAPAGKVFCVTRMIGYIEDAGGMRAERYASLTGALTNGITLKVHATASNGEIADLTNGDPIKRNGQWGMLCYDVDVKSWGAGNDILLFRYSFDRYGAPIELHEEDRIVLTFNDDFTGIVYHHFLFEGILK